MHKWINSIAPGNASFLQGLYDAYPEELTNEQLEELLSSFPMKSHYSKPSVSGKAWAYIWQLQEGALLDIW